MVHNYHIKRNIKGKKQNKLLDIYIYLQNIQGLGGSSGGRRGGSGDGAGAEAAAQAGALATAATAGAAATSAAAAVVGATAAASSRVTQGRHHAGHEDGDVLRDDEPVNFSAGSHPA